MAIDRAQQYEAYRRMLRIRRFEEEGAKVFKAGKIAGAFHASIGQEAAIVGACLALRDDDTIVGTHRSHGHPIGKGANLKALMAELMGKATGISQARGGSMHLADKSVGIIGQSAIVGGGIPLATGAALTAHVLNTGRVSLCFFGDGAVNQGTFHESLNMASLWKLPVIYVCENNGYAITTSLARSHAQPSIAKRGDAYSIPGFTVDGQDVEAVYEAAAAAVARARGGEGPSLIEAKTYRFDEHCVGLVIPGTPYRSADEVAGQIANRDPIQLFRTKLLQSGASEPELKTIAEEVESAVAEAIAFGESSPLPEVARIADHMFYQPVRSGLSERI